MVVCKNLIFFFIKLLSTTKRVVCPSWLIRWRTMFWYKFVQLHKTIIFNHSQLFISQKMYFLRKCMYLGFSPHNLNSENCKLHLFLSGTSLKKIINLEKGHQIIKVGPHTSLKCNKQNPKTRPFFSAHIYCHITI